MARMPDTILSHWHHSIGGLQASTQDFYAAIERALAAHALPDLRISRVLYPEEGALSAKREYLRVERRSFTFDACGAPFGRGFFVSWWLSAPLPPLVTRLLFLALCFIVWNVLTAILFAAVAGFFSMLRSSVMGLMLGSAVGFVGGIVGTFVLLHLAVQWRILDEHLVESIPIVGLLYRLLLSPLTYYRLDTAQMFRDVVHSAVLEAVEEITAGKGVKALTEAERKPVMRELLAS